MKLPDLFPRFVAAALFGLGAAQAAQDPVASIDNGLGELPNFREWKAHPGLRRIAVAAEAPANGSPGEKLDSGLGELPGYSEWKHHPELARLGNEAEPISALIERR